MMTSPRKTMPIIKILNSSLIDLPTPPNISYWWNFGSLLILCLSLQILTGLFLAMHYSPDVSLAFSSVSHIMRDVNYGWLFRIAHANGASLFFICIYMHVGRGVYYGSYKNKNLWLSGVLILLALMATAFLGYVLPWGQMSFWGATVITNLFSALPYVGSTLVTWLWGGFAVDNATLTRFFTLHFILPFLLLALVVVHITLLHETGSNNPLGLSSTKDKVPFFPFYTSKDLLGFTLTLLLFLTLILTKPNLLGDPENFNPANPLVTPLHIQPEWYFLYAYAILRSIPNSLGGVLALALAIAILAIPSITFKPTLQSLHFYPLNQILFWGFINTTLLLTWIGASPVEKPFLLIGQILSCLYFSYFLVNPFLLKKWDSLMNPQ